MAINADSFKQLAASVISLTPNYFSVIPTASTAVYNESKTKGAILSVPVVSGAKAEINPTSYSTTTNAVTMVDVTADYIQAKIPVSYDQLQSGLDPVSFAPALLAQLQEGLFQLIVNKVATVSGNVKTVADLGAAWKTVKGANKSIYFTSDLLPSTVSGDANAVKILADNRLEPGAYGFSNAQYLDDAIVSSTSAVGTIDYIAWAKEGLALGLASVNAPEDGLSEMIEVGNGLPALMLRVQTLESRNTIVSLEMIAGAKAVSSAHVSYGSKG